MTGGYEPWRDTPVQKSEPTYSDPFPASGPDPEPSAWSPEPVAPRTLGRSARRRSAEPGPVPLESTPEPRTDIPDEGDPPWWLAPDPQHTDTRPTFPAGSDSYRATPLADSVLSEQVFTEPSPSGPARAEAAPAEPVPTGVGGARWADAGQDEPTGRQPTVTPRTAVDRPVHRLDAEDVLTAVRDVPGVRAADLRTDPSGGRTLRLDVADGMDTDEVAAAASEALRSRFGDDTELAVAAGTEFDLDRDEAHETAELDARPVGNGLSQIPDPDGPPNGDRRAIIERIQVATAGAECAVEVCLTADGVRAVGRAGGPALDPYLLRVAALATVDAVGVLAGGRVRCAVEHVDVVTAGPCRVVVVVLVWMSGEAAERLVGSAVVTGDARQAAVRATMGALNRRLGPVLESVLTS